MKIHFSCCTGNDVPRFSSHSSHRLRLKVSLNRVYPTYFIIYTTSSAANIVKIQLHPSPMEYNVKAISFVLSEVFSEESCCLLQATSKAHRYNCGLFGRKQMKSSGMTTTTTPTPTTTTTTTKNKSHNQAPKFDLLHSNRWNLCIRLFRWK